MRSPLLAVLGAFMFSSIARAVVIDDFRDGAIRLETTTLDLGASAFQPQLNSSSVIGGSRNVYVGSTREGASLEIDPAAGQLRLSGPPCCGYFRLEYGLTEDLNVDLSSDGDSAFLLSFAIAPNAGPYWYTSCDCCPAGATRGGSLSHLTDSPKRCGRLVTAAMCSSHFRNSLELIFRTSTGSRSKDGGSRYPTGWCSRTFERYLRLGLHSSVWLGAASCCFDERDLGEVTG